MFVTAFYGIYDCRTGHIDYTNAGHTPPYILSCTHEVEPVRMETNFVMGIFDDFQFESGRGGGVLYRWQIWRSSVMGEGCGVGIAQSLCFQVSNLISVPHV